MGSFHHQSPFTPTNFGFGGQCNSAGSGLGEGQMGGGASPYAGGLGSGGGGGGGTPRLRSSDLHAGSDPWSSFLLQPTAPRAENVATPSSRFRPTGGAYGFGPELGGPQDASGWQDGQPRLDAQRYGPMGAMRMGSGSGLQFGSMQPQRGAQQEQQQLQQQQHAQKLASLDAPPIFSMSDAADLDGGLGSASGVLGGTAGVDMRRPAAFDAAEARGQAHESGAAGLGLGDESSGHWVTVFGFSGELFPVVLRELQPSGAAMLAHAQGGGNWVHVRLSSELEVAEAVAKSGRVVAGSMIGVLPGIHPYLAETGNGSRQQADLLSAQRLKRTVWLAPAQPPLENGLGNRAGVSVAGVQLVSSRSAPYAPYSSSGLSGVLMRVTEYLFGW